MLATAVADFAAPLSGSACSSVSRPLASKNHVEVTYLRPTIRLVSVRESQITSQGFMEDGSTSSIKALSPCHLLILSPFHPSILLPSHPPSHLLILSFSIHPSFSSPPPLSLFSPSSLFLSTSLYLSLSLSISLYLSLSLSISLYLSLSLSISIPERNDRCYWVA